MGALDRFDAHIKPDGGRALVIGSAIIGGAFVLGGLVLSEPLLVLVALIAFAVSLYNYPLLRARDPHLSASLLGLQIDGLGTVDWGSIADLKFEQEGDTSSMTCTFADTLDQAVKQTEEAGALRNLQVNLWRLQEDGSLVIDLSNFTEAPQDIYEAVDRFYNHTNDASPL